MPMSGAKPKPDGQKRHRVKPVTEWVEIVADPFTGGPRMPAKMADGRVWPSSTRRWWRAVSSMPHCRLWTEADWSFALDSLQVAATFHYGDVRAATELRNREKVLGTTIDFRRDLRIRYVTVAAEVEGAEDVAHLDDYRTATS